MRASESGHINDSTKRIVEYSSGNTAISLGIVSRIMDGPQVGTYISNKTSSQKMDLLRFFVSFLSLSDSLHWLKLLLTRDLICEALNIVLKVELELITFVQDSLWRSSSS